MLQIEQMRAASKMASHGEVTAVFKVSLELFVTIGYEKGELDSLTAERLRASLVEQANGMIGLIETADAIEIGEIIEVRDSSTDKAIEVDGVGQRVCEKCGSPMHGGYCSDDTCPYSEWPQNIPLRELLRDPPEVLRERYGVQQRLRVDAEVHSEMIMATIEGDSFTETIEFSSDEVVAHHMPGSAHVWENLSEEERESFSEDYALWKFARQYGDNAELRVSVEIQDDYRFILIGPGKYEACLRVDGVPCPGRMGLLTGRPGNWEAEWVDGSRVGTFDTLQDGAKALKNYIYRI